MNVISSQEERERAPTWSTTWGKLWKNRDRAQFEQIAYRCDRCAKLRAHNPERGFWQYGWPEAGLALRMECGHFIKAGQPLPPSTIKETT